MRIEGAELKQSTVMSADVVGYTAMMAADAHATLSNLFACFRRVESLVKQYGGRIVDAPGDNMLIEFPNEVGAVLCAVEVQRMLEAMRRVLPGSALHMRIGLDAGESIARCGRLYGDPVNVAARLQTAAEPDGILLSEAVAERLPDSMQRTVGELGERQYKNVPYVVRTYSAWP
jgi:class 3 adenylate cyclase